MAVELIMRKTGGGLWPASKMDEALLSQYNDYASLKVKLTQPRSIPHSNKWHALLSVVYPHQDLYKSYDNFRRHVQRAMGYFEVENGEIYDISISFKEMDQAEFNQFYEEGVKLIMERIIPLIDRGDLEREVQEIMAGRRS